MSETFISEENKSIVDNAIARVVSEQLCGVELVEIRYSKQFGTNTLEILLWKKDGITFDDCEAVHNAVSAELDKFDDMFSTAYNLNVSSQGLDRKIVSDDDFRRALDTEIEFSCDKKKFHGTLKAFDGESVFVLIGGAEKQFLRNSLTGVRPYVSF